MRLGWEITEADVMKRRSQSEVCSRAAKACRERAAALVMQAEALDEEAVRLWQDSERLSTFVTQPPCHAKLNTPALWPAPPHGRTPIA